MFTGWFEKSLGHIVAPDENIIPRKESNQASLFERILLAVAPDPVYEEKIQKAEEDGPVDIEAPTRKSEDAPPKTTTMIKSPPPPPTVPVPQRGPPPAEAFLSPVATLKTETGQVQCQHCQKLTPVRSSTVDPQFQTPKAPPPEARADDELEQKVISAAKVTAQCERTPPPEHSTIFRFCSSSKPLEGKLVNKLKKVCVKHPKLLKSRSVQAMGESAPKGYTPFLTAVYQSNLEAAKIILEQNPEAYLDVNLAGQSALHIAAQEGHSEMIEFLQGIDKRPHQSIVDLNGITALGEALTSPKAKARKNRSHLQQALFSPEDLSIRGTPLPASNRERVHRAIDLACGEAELPGLRVIMEDAKVLRSWQNENGQFFCLLGVCDGHGDNGLVSKEVAESLATMIKEKTEEASAHNSDGGFDWKKIFADACESVDEKVKASGLPGGSTGVFALITKYEIIVANVGDSRCILVQDQSATSNDQDNRPSTPQLAEESEPVTLEEPADGIENGNRNGDDGGNGATVTAAGEDTAPNEEEGKSSESAPPPASIAEASAENSEGKAMKTLPIVVALSDDHKPNLEEEKERIEGAGLSVLAETFEEEGKLITIHKVQKSGSDKMAVSRSFGDFEYKRNKELGAREQAVIAMPDTRIHVRNANDMFVVLACDGVWDVMTNDEVGKFVLDQYEKLPNGNARGSGLLSQLADALILECFHRGSTDNMTVIVAALNKTVDKFAGGLIQGKALTFMSPPGKNQLTTP